ncbi:MAG: S8 family serine peptidase [Candidatus Hydrothermae bacterium]|nr:S8 family serine peptidase [Candidatus Hydrothermae bacterium]
MKLRGWLGLVPVLLAFPLHAARITPQLEAHLQQGGPVTAIVVLRDQVNLMQYKDLSYHQRAELLREVARTTQAPILKMLEGRPDVYRVRSFWVANLMVVRAEPQVIRALAQRPDVREIRDIRTYHVLGQPSHASKTPPRIQTVEWNISQIKADSVWYQYGLSGLGVLVGILDTGIDPSHPALAGNFSGYFHDAVGGQTAPYDDHGHGTHVAGTIAATINNGVGIAGMANVRLYSLRALNAQRSGTYTDIADAIRWAAQNGIPIISMSLGGPSGNSTLQSACTYAWNQGSILIVASGNDGRRAISYPAAYSTTVAVGALDSNGSLAYYSNYGPEQEVVAPGSNILSTVPFNSYASLSGTSMATPHVSGVAALILSVNSSLSNQQVRDILRNTATDLGTQGWDERYGYGEVNAFAAVQAAQGGGGGTPPPSTPPGNGNHQGGPDAGGYAWIDSHAQGGPSFVYYRRPGTQTSLNADDGTVTLTLPFSFPFYGQTYNQIIVGSNGIIEFANAQNPYSNASLPRTSMGPLLAPFWDDLTVLNSQGSSVYAGAVGSGRYAIEWVNVHRYNDTATTLTFEVILDQSGDIYFSYSRLSGNLQSATVGIQSDGGKQGALQVTYNGSNAGHPEQGMTVYFQAPKRQPGHSGGPDSWGYTWIDSHRSDGPSYLWYTRDNTWGKLAVDGDDRGVWYRLPFSFPFYGQTYTSVYVGSNGFLSFVKATNPYTNGSIPNRSYSGFLAPFWDDLTVYSRYGSGIYVKQVSSTRVVILYENVHRYGDSRASYTFEVILDADGTVHYSYKTLNGTVTSATVGLQGGSGTGLKVTYNGSYSGHPEAGLTIRFNPGSGPAKAVQASVEGLKLTQVRVVGRTLRLGVRMSAPGGVRVRVLDALGRQVEQRRWAALSSGQHELSVPLRTRRAGVYFLRVETPTATLTRKLWLR